MKIAITDKAAEKLGEIFRNSDFKNPALRLVYQGYG